MNGASSPGARWLACDLHVHSPFDEEKQFGEDIRGAVEALRRKRPDHLAAMAGRFIEACQSAVDGRGLDLVAVTDHNSIDGYLHLKPHFDSLAQEAKAEGRTVPTVLPGVEFSVGGERPIHFLVVFASETEPNEIDAAIGHVFGVNQRFDPDSGTPRATGQSVDGFLQALYEFCCPPAGEREIQFVVLPAHADGRRGLVRETASSAHSSESPLSVSTTLWDEMKGHLRQRVITRRDWHGFQTIRPYDRLPQAFKELLWRWFAARRGEDWDGLSEAQKARYREQRQWGLVECSDPHSYEAIGTHFTWLKMEVPDVEGIRLALLDPESRLRRMEEGPPRRDHPLIERVRVNGTDFFDEIEVPFSPCLTTLIGGRGSGKSTVIEYLRHCLDRCHNDDFAGEGAEEIRESVEEMLGEKQQRDFGETAGTLLPTYRLRLDVVVEGKRYHVTRTPEGIEIEKESPTGSAQPVDLDIRTLIMPRILSQRQIARIARDPNSQRSELDALLDPSELNRIEEGRASIMEELARLQLHRKSVEERVRHLPARRTELQKLDDQIDYLEKDGRADVFERFSSFGAERSWIEDALDSLEGQAASLEEHAEELSSLGGDDLPESGDWPSFDWLETVLQRIRNQSEAAAASLARLAGGFRTVASEIEAERDKAWVPGFEDARSAYDALIEEMQTQGFDLEQHETLVQRRDDLRRKVGELEGAEGELRSVKDEVQSARAELIESRRERLGLRQERARALEEVEADIRLEIVEFGDRPGFEAQREAWFGGAGLKERDWRVLVDFVFGDLGSQADRIEALVDALRQDIGRTGAKGAPIEADESSVCSLLGPDLASRLTGFFFRALEHGDRIYLDEMERSLPEDAVEARVRSEGGEFSPISTASVGQRSTAILSLLLSAGRQPLIVDQPEDDLDNRYIYDVVVSLLRERKFSRQIIAATHNANISVNGDAELIIALGTEERLGTLLAAGSIDRVDVKNEVSQIMEGSAEAFRLRRERYGF